MSRIRALASTVAILILQGAAAPARAAPAVEAYGKLPAIEHVSLSPSGERIAFVSVVGDKRKLFARVVGGDALAVAEIGDSKVRAVNWAGDDHVVVRCSTTLGDRGPHNKWRGEFGWAVILNVKTGKILRVFDKSIIFGALEGGYYGASEVDGRWYAYFRGANALYRVDVDTGALKRMDDDLGVGGWVVDGSGAVVARARYDSDSKSVQVLSGSQGRTVAFKRVSDTAQVDVEGLGRAPGTVAVLDQSGTQDHLLEVALASGKETELLAEKDVEDLYFDRQSRRLIGAELIDHTPVMFDPAHQATMDSVRRAFPKLRVRLVSYDTAFDRLLVYTDGGDDAGTYWIIDRKTGKAAELDEAHPDIRPEDVGPTSVFAWKASDGLAIEGVLTLPPASALSGRPAKDLPVVVLPHGGPLDVRDDLGFDWFAQAFASRGYAVLQPNYRGSAGKSAAFRNAGRGEWGGRMLSDISDGLTALQTAGVAAPGRACIVGGSYGGYAALAGVTLQHGFYRCAVSVGGVSNLGELLARRGDRSTSPVTRYLRTLMGGQWAGDAKLAAISPAHAADKASAPILLIHGRDDSVVLVQQSEEMASALRAANKSYKLEYLDGEDHWLSREKTRVEMLRLAVGFVEANNPVQAAASSVARGATSSP